MFLRYSLWLFHDMIFSELLHQVYVIIVETRISYWQGLLGNCITNDYRALIINPGTWVADITKLPGLGDILGLAELEICTKIQLENFNSKPGVNSWMFPLKLGLTVVN